MTSYYDKLESIYAASNTHVECDIIDGHHFALNLSHVWTIFIIYGYLNFIAICIFFMRWWWHRTKKGKCKFRQEISRIVDVRKDAVMVGSSGILTPVDDVVVRNDTAVGGGSEILTPVD